LFCNLPQFTATFQGIFNRGFDQNKFGNYSIPYPKRFFLIKSFLMKKFHLSFLFVFLITFSFAQSIIDFEEFDLPVDTFLNNATPMTRFQSGAVFFPNVFNPDFGGFWESGWAISTVRDDTTSGFTNLYGVITGSGAGVGGSSRTFAVGQQNSIINLSGDALGKVVNGLYITNTTFAHNSMRDGDDFAKQFGGEDGTDPDFFKLEIQKYSNGQLAPQIVEFYLADFRSDDSNEDFIVNEWQWVDLTSLGNVDSLQFTMSSSDVGANGINTPLFFAIDNLEVSNDISTNTENVNLTNTQITFYPNPAINEIIIDAKEEGIAGTLQIFDMLGRSLIQQAFGNNQQRIDIARLERGTYILQITTTEGKYFSSTFLKQ